MKLVVEIHVGQPAPGTRAGLTHQIRHLLLVEPDSALDAPNECLAHEAIELRQLSRRRRSNVTHGHPASVAMTHTAALGELDHHPIEIHAVDLTTHETSLGG